jgi:hypothetical protein
MGVFSLLALVTLGITLGTDNAKPLDQRMILHLNDEQLPLTANKWPQHFDFKKMIGLWA